MKRVKYQPKKPINELFEKWLLEWKKDAAEQGMEKQHVFGKALRSLQKYPLPVRSGKDCIILENFGAKICEMLDKELNDYRKSLTNAEWEKLMTGSLGLSALTSSTNLLDRDNPTPRKTKNAVGVGGSQLLGNLHGTHSKSSPGKQKNPVTPSKSSEYVPKYRSGPYAILVALINSSTGTLTKTALQEAAQPLSDMSFTKPLPGSHYTAWSSMATLLKKDLVTKGGRPVRFTLTESGVSLGRRLASLSDDEIKTLAANPTSSQVSSTNFDSGIASQPPEDIMLDEHLTFPSQSVTPQKLKKTVVPRKKAASTVGSSADKNSPSQPHDDIMLDEDLPFSSQNGTPQKIKKAVEPRKKAASTVGRNLDKDSHPQTPEDIMLDEDPPFSSQSVTPQKLKKPVEPRKKAASIVGKNLNSEEVMSSQQSQSQDTEPFETFFLFPGCFKIILLVDVRETEMKTHTRVDVALQNLKRKGIECETRTLTAGDFVWVARDSAGTELLLPYIVERKRLDDLAHGIKNGRFHEQKFRLKGSKVPNIIYLLEQHGKDFQRLGLPLPTLQQAAANTQVVDEFIIKVSKSHDDSMLYLSCLTKLIIRHFKDKTLVSCQKKDLAEVDLSSDLIHLMPFKQFLKESTKTKKFTVKEMLVKHLVQLKGMSADKATAIAEKYPTPMELAEALREEGEKCVVDLHVGPLRRLGPALGKSIHQLYTRQVLS